LDVDIVPTHPCNGMNNGSATIQISGGVGPFDVVWLGSESNELTITGLGPGLVAVTVTDLSNGSNVFVQQIILEGPSLSAEVVSSTEHSSVGACDAEVNLSVDGGVPPFSVNWPAASNVSADGLSASGFCEDFLELEVADHNGCTVLVSVDVESSNVVSNEMEVVVEGYDVLCAGFNNGSALISISNGDGPYEIKWLSGNFTGTTEVYSAGDIEFEKTGFVSGQHAFTLTDQGTGASMDYEVNIGEPDVLLAYVTSSDMPSNCDTCDASFNLTIEGGTEPYIVTWPDNAIMSGDGQVSGVCAGVHVILVTDSNNCTSSASLVLTCDEDENPPVDSPEDPTDEEPGDEIGEIVYEEIHADVRTTSPSCPGSADGSAKIENLSGGAGDFTFEWSDYVGNEVTADGLEAGYHTVTITDLVGNSMTMDFSIAPAIFEIVVVSSDATPNLCNGKVVFQDLIGGVPPFEIEEFAFDNNALCPGDYQFSVIDGTGCVATAEFTINETPLFVDVVDGNSFEQGDVIAYVGDVGHYEIVYDTDKVYLVSKTDAFQKGEPYTIYNSAGSIVQKGNLHDRTSLLDLGDFRHGMYLFHVGNEVLRFINR